MRSGGDGWVDVAVRRCRAWSAPAAPLSHIRGHHRRSLAPRAEQANGSDHAHSTLPSAVYRLFPTQTVFNVADVPFAPSPPTTSNGVHHAQTSPRTEGTSPDDLRAELQAAKYQIQLLNAASAQSFKSYADLESENADLRDANRRLREANDELKALLSQRNDEVNEQLHLICELQKKLEEFSGFSAAPRLSSSKALNGDAK